MAVVWRSFRRSSSVRTHRGVRAATEAGHARARELAGRRLEVTCLDALDRLHHDRAAALQILFRQQLLAIFLEARGAADAEDVLAHAAPDPVLRVIEREVPRRESERLALLVEALPARDVIQG